MWHFQLQRVSIVVPRYLRSIIPRREITSVDVYLLVWQSVRISQQGICAMCRVG
jgi:hypothetical protein